MPTIPGSNGFEYDLEIVTGGVTYSIDNGDFDIANNQLAHDMAAKEIPMLQFAITLNSATRNFNIMDSVRLLVRAIGEANYTVRFTGFLNQHEMCSRNNVITCQATGKEILMKAVIIPHAEFGNELVENQAMGYEVSGAIDLWFELDATNTIQIPLLRASIHSGLHSLIHGSGPETNLNIYGGNVTSQTVSIPFYHAGGELYGFAAYVGCAVNCNQDLLLTIESPTTFVNMIPDGVALLTAVLSYDIWTSTGWYYFTFTAQKTPLPAGIYCAHFEQAGSSVLSDASNPFWSLYTTFRASPRDSTAYAEVKAGGAWATNFSSLPFYIPDSEGSYVDLKYGEDYLFRVEGAYKRAYLFKNGVGYRYRSDIYPQNVKALPLCRFSYWKGDIDYSSVMEDMLQDWAYNIYDTGGLDISVSDPVVKFQGLIIHNKTLWDAMLQFKEYQNIAWRIYDNLSGTCTLEVRDKIQLSSWGAQTDSYKACRTFQHGDDATDDEYIKIRDFRMGKRLNNLCNTAMVVDSAGNVVVNADPSSDIDITFAFDSPTKIGGLGNDLLAKASEYILGQSRTSTKYGDIDVTDLDLSTSSAAYLSANELVYIKSSEVSVDGAYSISKITIDYGNGGRAKISLTDKIDIAFDTGIRGKNDIVHLLNTGWNPELVDGACTADTELLGASLNLGAQMDGVLSLQAGDIGAGAYVTGDEYAVAFGVGTPNLSGNVMGLQILQVDAEVLELSGGGAIVRAEIDWSAMTSTLYDSGSPNIGEIGLYKNGACIGAKTIGTDRDGGSMSIAKPRPRMRMGSGRKTVVFVRLVA